MPLSKGVVPLSDTVLVAIIGLVGSGLGSLIGVIASSKLTQYRLEQLEKKVDKHNNVVERMYALEERVAINEEKIKVENHRIEDLEGFHKS
jgi:ABC-type lipoprotein release transport system permease subunit